MKKRLRHLLHSKITSIVIFYLVVTIMTAITSDAEAGRYAFGDVKSNDNYLIDTHTGRLWKNSGTASKPTNFVPVKYVDSNGNLVLQPEETTVVAQYDGRFSFIDINSNDYYMLDIETGRVWKLDGTAAHPKKLVSVIIER